MIEAIIVIVIIVLLVVVLFIALEKLINTMNEDVKNDYFNKIDSYNEEIISKEKKLDELNKEINEKSKEEKEDKKENINPYTLDKATIDNYINTEYETVNALKLANKVDEIFYIDDVKIINDFLAKTKVNMDYKIYQDLLDRFSPNLIYKLKMLDRDSQIKELSKMLTDKEYDVFMSYINAKKFKLEKFLIDLELLISNNKPKIEIIVGNKKKNYNYLSPYIVTVYSEDVYKGIIIKYQDRIYDYSINERDV